MTSQKAGDLGSTDERNNHSFDISPRTPERKENTLFSASVPTEMENIHDEAIIEDPRFEGKKATIYSKLINNLLFWKKNLNNKLLLGYEEQITKSKVMEFSVLSQAAHIHNSQIIKDSIHHHNMTNTSKLLKSMEKRGKHRRTKSPMLEDVYKTQKEIQNLTEDDILNYNFLQNFLELIDSEEFFVDSITSQENLINHIIYMIKQYLRKRNFDPNMLINGLKNQLLQENDKFNSARSKCLKLISNNLKTYNIN